MLIHSCVCLLLPSHTPVYLTPVLAETCVSKLETDTCEGLLEGIEFFGDERTEQEKERPTDSGSVKDVLVGANFHES